MADKKLIDEVGKYIDKYYEPVKDDIKMDKEMKSIFDKITKCSCFLYEYYRFRHKIILFFIFFCINENEFFPYYIWKKLVLQFQYV